jgi:hypothetical protein
MPDDKDNPSDRPVLVFKSGRKLRADPGPCLWCGEWVETGRRMSGATDPLDPAWQNDGDFGCDKAPNADDEECGDHSRPWDLARAILDKNKKEG